MNGTAQAITPAVWFPTIRASSGSDVFTERLAAALNQRGIKAEIMWLPHRAEYAPWTVKVPKPPAWANVVHVNTWLPKRFIPRNLPVLTTSHLCVHDQALEPWKSFAQKMYHRFWVKPTERIGIANAQAVTAVSHYTREQNVQVFGRSDIEVVHNGIDMDKFEFDFRQRPNEPFRLLYVGNYSVRKGSDLLHPIMRALGSEFELRVTASKQEVERFGELPENIMPVGRISDARELNQVISGSDALIFPTRLEGFGLVALEAQACARPVVATNCSSLPEVVKHGETGFLCEPGNVQGFKNAVARLQSDINLWRRMCSAARDHACKHFDESKLVDRYCELYLDIINSGSVTEKNSGK